MRLNHSQLEEHARSAYSGYSLLPVNDSGLSCGIINPSKNWPIRLYSSRLNTADTSKVCQ